MSHDPDPPPSQPEPAPSGSRPSSGEASCAGPAIPRQAHAGRRATQVHPCAIDWQNPCRYPEAGARRHRSWLEPVVTELVPGGGSLVVRFTGDRAIRRLNAAYRQRDTATDVLSFPGAEPAATPADDPFALAEEAEGRHVGDIVISVPTARRQAASLGHDVERELRVLMLHGLLHCLGYDHESDDGTMERLEKRLRRRFLSRSAEDRR